MIEWLTAFTLVIFVAVLGGLVRVLRGPTRADRMLAAQLFSTAGVAMAVLLAYSRDSAWLYDIAMVFALLSAVATTTFVRLTWRRTTGEEETVHVVD
jgi:multicomponent Na+:H+ antiporter subunit F